MRFPLFNINLTYSQIIINVLSTPDECALAAYIILSSYIKIGSICSLTCVLLWHLMAIRLALFFFGLIFIFVLISFCFVFAICDSPPSLSSGPALCLQLWWDTPRRTTARRGTHSTRSGYLWSLLPSPSPITGRPQGLMSDVVCCVGYIFIYYRVCLRLGIVTPSPVRSMDFYWLAAVRTSVNTQYYLVRSVLFLPQRMHEGRS